MIRLEGDTLPREARGAVPPILFGDLLLDVPGIPIQVGWAATLADACGIELGPVTLRLGGADLAELLAAVPAAGVVQLEQEWLRYTEILPTPPRLVIAERGYRETVPAVHARGTTIYFVETRPIYVLAYVPPGCSYPDDMVIQLRVNDQPETPPATVRLADERIVPGVRLVTVEFDARKAFYTPPAPVLPSHVVLGGTTWGYTLRMGKAGPSTGRVLGAPGQVTGRSGPAGGVGYGRVLGPPPPRILGRPGAAPFTGNGGQRLVTLRQGALGRVSADLKGLRDTPAGRYSGVPGGGLVQPAAIVRLLLEETYGETDPAAYHPPSWAATAARHVQRGITWRLVWPGEAFEAFREAAQLCGQADLYLDDEGRWRYAFRDPDAPTVGTLTPRELLEEPAMGWSAGRALVTELEVAWGEGRQGGTLTLDSPAMRDRHGRNHGGVSLPYAATEPIARQLGRYELSRRDRPRQSVTVRTSHAWLGLTVADRVFVDTPLLQLYGAKRVPFEIVGITDRGAERVLVLLEGDPLALARPLSGTLDLGASTGTLIAALAGLGLAAAGIVGVFVDGTLAATLGGVTLAAAGTVTSPPSTGTLTGTLAALTCTAAGTVTAGGGTFPTFGHATTVGDTGTSSDTVQSFTTAAGETYLLVCVGIRGVSLSSVQAVTFGATSLTQLKDQLDAGGTMRAVLYGGVVPGSSTNNVTVDYLGGNANAVIAIRAYVGVVSVGTAVSAFTASATSLAVTLTGVTNARCVDFIVVAHGDNSPTLGAGQTAEFTEFQDGGAQIKMAGSFENADTSMSWTGLNHANDDAILIAVPLVGV